MCNTCKETQFVQNLLVRRSSVLLKIKFTYFTCSTAAGSTDSVSQPKQGTAKKSFKPAVSTESLSAAAEQQLSQLQQLAQPPASSSLDKPTVLHHTAVKRRVESLEFRNSGSGVKKQRRESTEDPGRTSAFK